MSHRISAARRPSSEVFFNLFFRLDRLTELSVADLFRHCHQLLDQFPETLILLYLLPRKVHGGALRDHARASLAAHCMRQRIARPMSFRALLGAMAGRFSALAEPSHQRTGPHLSNVGDPVLQLVALQKEGLKVRVVGHVCT